VGHRGDEAFGLTTPKVCRPEDGRIQPRVLIVHKVADYAAWKKVFDGAAGIRREAGERSYQVLRDQREPHRVVQFSAWTSLAAARAFFESPRLVKIRSEAGVKAPEFIYLEESERGTL
jgi:quinol monooxygenase YgiN